jgi:GGDEF domain-containing protein
MNNNGFNGVFIDASREIAEKILNAAPFYIFVEDAVSDKMIFANKSFKKDFTEEAESSSDYSILHDTLREYCDGCPKKKAAGKCIPHTFKVRQNDFVKDLEVQCVRIFWFDGRPARVFVCRNITELQYYKECAEKAPFVDPLTDLPSRRRFAMDFLALPEHFSGGIVRLNMINYCEALDDHGFEWSDALLLNVSQYLRDVFASAGKLYFHGGGDFLCLFESSARADAEKALALLSVKNSAPWHVKGKEFKCRFAAGITEFSAGKRSIAVIGAQISGAAKTFL